MNRFSHYSMGTTFEIIIAGQPQSYAQQAANAVFAEIDRLEQVLSRFDPCSDTSLINRLKPGQKMLVSIEFMECLRLSKQVYDLTAGAFDVTMTAAQPMADGECTKKEQPEFGGISFNGDGTVSFATGNNGCTYRLDFGGIGKGFALDKVLDILEDWEIDRFLLHGGTSTALARGDALGNPHGIHGWPVGLDGAVVYLDRMALSGSGKEVKGEHIQDPRTGHPARGHLLAWVFHPSAALADALSTACIVLSPQELVGFQRQHPEIDIKVKEYPK